MTLTDRLTAAGFALGAAAHAIALALMVFGIRLYGQGYPAWRHLAMVSVDLSIAFIAVKRPRWLVVVLPAFLVEQLVVNGPQLTAALALLTTVAAVWTRRPR